MGEPAQDDPPGEELEEELPTLPQVRRGRKKYYL